MLTYIKCRRLVGNPDCIESFENNHHSRVHSFVKILSKNFNLVKILTRMYKKNYESSEDCEV